MLTTVPLASCKTADDNHTFTPSPIHHHTADTSPGAGNNVLSSCKKNATVIRNLPFYGHEVHSWYPVPASTRTAWYPRSYILSTGVCLSAQLAVGATLAC